MKSKEEEEKELKRLEQEVEKQEWGTKTEEREERGLLEPKLKTEEQKCKAKSEERENSISLQIISIFCWRIFFLSSLCFSYYFLFLCCLARAFQSSFSSLTSSTSLAKEAQVGYNYRDLDYQI